ncbi:MAG: dienelactone hydrolase family protein [Acidobacteriota bacterium]
MIRSALLALVAHLASAGCALSASEPPPQPRLPAAGEHIEVQTSFGVVPTLVVRNLAAETAETTTPPALLIGLHGYGMDESQIATLVDIQPDFDHVYLAPRGFHQLPDGSHAWFPIAADGTEITVDPGDWQAFVDRFADYLQSVIDQIGADPESVIVIGYSQGGAAAITLAASRPDLASAYIGFAGSLLEVAGPFDAELHQRSSTRLFIGHGTLDPLIDNGAMEQHVEELRDLGLDLTYREYRVPHVVSAAQRRDVVDWLGLMTR